MTFEFVITAGNRLYHEFGVLYNFDVLFLGLVHFQFYWVMIYCHLPLNIHLDRWVLTGEGTQEAYPIRYISNLLIGTRIVAKLNFLSAWCLKKEFLTISWECKFYTGTEVFDWTKNFKLTKIVFVHHTWLNLYVYYGVSFSNTWLIKYYNFFPCNFLN